MNRTIWRAITLTAAVTTAFWFAGHYELQVLGQGGAPPAGAQGGRGRRGAGGGGGARGARGAAPPQNAQTAATNDLTGYWARLVTEDWRWLMVVPPKGNADSIALTQAGRAVLDAWDPAKDEAEGTQCKGYGAGAISRLPTRAHVTWQDGDTLKWETDQGMQTRLFKFGTDAEAASENPGERTWQGFSVATWEPVAGGRGGRGGPGGPGGPPGGIPGGFAGGPPPPAPAADDDAATPPPPAGGPQGAFPAPGGARGGNQTGWLRVVTTNLKPGYLRKNGLPYSEKTTVTEYFQPTPETYGIRYMVVTTIVEDPEYLAGPLITSSNYKKLPDTNNGWDPQPCSVR